jgi:hypothetical protein
LGVAGANFSPTSSLTAYAHWIQGSLAGMGPATQIAQVTVHAGYDASFTAGSNGSTATVSYIADSLPDGTVITAFVENSTARVAPLLSTPATPILTLIISWVAPDGTVPNTATGKPIVMTITNSNITAGSKVYGLVGNVPVYLGTSIEDGQVQVAISEDPAVIVALVTPDAPRAVTAVEVDATSARVSWTAPASNGGSAITGFTARSNTGQSCSSSTTTCVISGLATGLEYTFSVIATNAIGNGPASNASSPIRLDASVVPPSSTTSTLAPSTNTLGNEVSNVKPGDNSKAGQDKEALDEVSNVKPGDNSKAGQDKEALDVAGEVLESVKDKITEDAQNALESQNDKAGANGNKNSHTDNKPQESSSENGQDSQNNAPALLILIAILLLAAFVAIRSFFRRN